jgi:cytochrome d ubiquinol oxidase subunit II
MILDYATLKVIWWFFISLLFILFFILGGRDFGVSILLPFLSKNDEDRRLIINSIGSTWEGNQVWFITAGGATFAAWPIVYATAFSGLYYALFLVLLTLILRPPGIDFRSKLPSKNWRLFWDWAIFSSGFVPALVFGVALGNLLLGLPFHFDMNLQSHYEGNFFQLLNPFAILFGLCAVAILGLHGGMYLLKKLPPELTGSVMRINMILGLTFITIFLLLGIWIAWGVSGYQIHYIGDVQNNLIPIMKEVIVAPKAWLINYNQHQALWAFPIITVVAVILAIFSTAKQWATFGIVMSSLAITCALLTANAAMFPFILPSSIHPSHSVTLWDATSSHRTLAYMFWVTVVFLPIVLFYTTWVFRVLSGKMESKTMLNKAESY